MRGRIAVLMIILCAAAMTAHSARPSKSKSNVSQQSAPTQIADNSPTSRDYPDSLQASYYYTEGVKQARIYLNNTEAVELFLKAIAIDSLHSASYFEAASALAMDNPEAALEYSRTANLIDSTNIWYKAQLGRLLVHNRQYKDAKPLYEQLIELSPRNPENYSMLAALYEFDKQPFAAIAVLEKSEAAVGKIEQLSEYKRELLISVGLYDRAIEEGRSLVANYPYNYESYLSLAQLYAQTKRDSLAMENYRMALNLNPDALDITASMNQYYKAKGDAANYLETSKKLIQSKELPVEVKIKILDEATSDRNFYSRNFFHVRELAAALYVQYPNYYPVLEKYALSMVAHGDIEGALVLHKSYLSDTITDLKPYNDILEIEAYLNRPDSVNKYSELALKHFPSSDELYLRQGGALQYMKREKDALKVYEKAYKFAQSDSMRSVVRGIIGDLHHVMGDSKKAFDSYRKALSLWGDNVTVLNNYAYYLSELDRDMETALAMAARVMELEPGNATYIDTYGWILYKLGRYEQAKKAMQQALALDTTKSDVLLVHYGDILHALGDNFMAEVYWNRALEAGHDSEQIEKRIQSLKEP